MFFVFKKICFKVKVLKMFKISSDCHIKTCRSPKRRESRVPFFRRTYALSVGFKMKLLRKVFSCVKAKINSNFAVNLAKILKEATIHFCLFNEIIFFKHPTLEYVTMERIELN